MSMNASNLMKNVPLNQFIGLSFDWIEEQRASAGGRIFQSQWSMDHSRYAKNSSKIDRRFKRSTNQKFLPVVWWVVMCLGFENWLADYLVDWWGLPKPFFLGPRPGVCFDSPFLFWRIQISCQKTRFFKLEGLHSRATKWSKAKELHPKDGHRIKKI